MTKWGKVGENLRKARENKKLTLRDVAKLIGKDHSYVSKVENGKTRPNLDYLERMAEIYDVDITYFFNAEEIDIPEELVGDIDFIALAKDMAKEGISAKEVREVLEFVKKIKTK